MYKLPTLKKVKIYISVKITYRWCTTNKIMKKSCRRERPRTSVSTESAKVFSTTHHVVLGMILESIFHGLHACSSAGVQAMNRTPRTL